MTLNEYEVEINGLPHTIQLNDEDAARLGLQVPEQKARTPKNKAAKPAVKSHE